MRSIRDLVSFFLVRAAGGGLQSPSFDDKSGSDESIGVARSWIAKNAANTGAAASIVSDGTVVL